MAGWPSPIRNGSWLGSDLRPGAVSSGRSRGIDPHFRRARWRMRQTRGEAFRMRGVSRSEHGRPRGDALLSQAVMHVGRRQQDEAGMIVFRVVPREEDMVVGPGILDRAGYRQFPITAVFGELGVLSLDRLPRLAPAHAAREARPRAG
jgi:hypothetical protein